VRTTGQKPARSDVRAIGFGSFAFMPGGTEGQRRE
jgi:hypothetical protein